MNRPSDNGLTIEQRTVARDAARLLSIQAGPGTGKTRVAAHRFGLLRFDSRDPREVVALSFTRSAAAELRDRIEALWGSVAVVWPHSVGTIDDFYRRLVGHLLAERLVYLPGYQTRLEVRDAWTADDGWSNTKGEWEINLLGVDVVVDRIVHGSGEGFVSSQAAQAHLDRATCTHSEIRLILTRALEDESLRSRLTDYLHGCIKAVIIDEVYDGNDTEAKFMALFAQAGLHLTVIGDPRQVLYEFRGSDPKKIEQAAAALKMTGRSLCRSHRFGPAVKPIVDALYDQEPLTVEELEEHDPPQVDVMLSSEWRTLWKVRENVMPLRRGKVKTPVDAALHMLIDACAVRGTGFRGASVADAERILSGLTGGLSPDVDTEELGALLEGIGDGFSREDAARLLDRAAGLIAADRRHRSVISMNILAADHVECLKDLARRWSKGPGNLVPGLSIHQAKGREWNRVALCVTERELEEVRRGLPLDKADTRWMTHCHRRLYVGMTRARKLIVVVTAGARGQACWYRVTAAESSEW